MDESNNVGDAASVSNEDIKRPLEISEENEERNRKMCKTNDDGINDQPAMSKRKLKKILNHQKWLENKPKRR